MTRIVQNPSEAAEFLKKGKVVALPSETVYGLGASIFHEHALSQIFTLKNRPQDNPLIVHALDLDMIKTIAYVTEDFLKIYQAFMPGPITVLLNKKNVSDLVSRGQQTIAVRVPSHPLFRAVLSILNQPIAAPSANLSGKPSSTCAMHVYDDFQHQLEMILDGGVSQGGLESTIIKIEKDHCLILRPGAITKEMIEHVLQRPCVLLKRSDSLVVPGMKYRHYAPQARVQLIHSLHDVVLDAQCMVMATQPIIHDYYEKLSDENLYRAFRLADEKGLKTIYVFIDDSLSEALINRLEKACC